MFDRVMTNVSIISRDPAVSACRAACRSDKYARTCDTSSTGQGYLLICTWRAQELTLFQATQLDTPKCARALTSCCYYGVAGRHSTQLAGAGLVFVGSLRGVNSGSLITNTGSESTFRVRKEGIGSHGVLSWLNDGSWRGDRYCSSCRS